MSFENCYFCINHISIVAKCVIKLCALDEKWMTFQWSVLSILHDWQQLSFKRTKYNCFIFIWKNRAVETTESFRRILTFNFNIQNDLCMSLDKSFHNKTRGWLIYGHNLYFDTRHPYCVSINLGLLLYQSYPTRLVAKCLHLKNGFLLTLLILLLWCVYYEIFVSVALCYGLLLMNFEYELHSYFTDI